MPEAQLDRRAVERLLDAAAARLTGEWLLLGGAAAAAWFSPDRVTEDVDLVGLDGTRDERLALMELAEAEGLPLEAVNSAAGFFLRRVDGWRDEMEVLRRGQATIHLPTPTLFLLLKIGRLSAADLADCLALLDHVRVHGGRLDRERVRNAIASLPETRDAALNERRVELSAALDRA
jgi:hypothetical protein